MGTFIILHLRLTLGWDPHNRTQMSQCLSSETAWNKATTVLKEHQHLQEGEAFVQSCFHVGKLLKSGKGRISHNPEAQFPSSTPIRAWHCPLHKDFQNCWMGGGWSRIPGYCSYIQKVRALCFILYSDFQFKKFLLRGWIGGSTAKDAYCSWRGPIWQLPTASLSSSRESDMLFWSLWAPSHTHTCTHN